MAVYKNISISAEEVLNELAKKKKKKLDLLI
jgi:predicted CopG family antitoxin